MRFAYGLCDFYRIITEQRVYVDRTDRLQTIEEGGDHLLFPRPAVLVKVYDYPP